MLVVTEQDGMERGAALWGHPLHGPGDQHRMSYAAERLMLLLLNRCDHCGAQIDELAEVVYVDPFGPASQALHRKCA